MTRKTKELLLLPLLTILLVCWNPGGLQGGWKPPALFSMTILYAIPAAVLTVVLSNLYHKVKSAREDNRHSLDEE